MSVVHEMPRPVSVGGPAGIVASFPSPRAFVPQQPDAQHLQHLEHAVTVALSPLDYSDATAWGDTLTASLCALADTSAGAYLLPGESVQWRAVTCDATTTAASWSLHDEATKRLHVVGSGDLLFWVRDDLAGNGPPHTAAARGTIGLRVRTADGAVAAVCVHRDQALGPASVQLITALRAIAPAFRAGIGTWLGAAANRSNVARMLDSLTEPALMFDVSGAIVHANPAADRLTTGTAASRLTDEAQRVAWALGAVARRRGSPRVAARSSTDATDAQSARRVQIGSTVYHLRGSIVSEHLLGTAPAVLVTITTATAEPMTDDTLRAEFHLTAREIEVARLMAEGLSNSEIAERIGVRFFTARNHVERTLAKLGVTSRHRVGPLLRNEAGDNAVAA